jgi:membrane protease YdiL (CAAX protease family)
MNILLNSSNELRSGWKVGAWLLFFIVLIIANLFAIDMILGAQMTEDQLTALTLQAVLLFFPNVGALIFVARLVDHKPVGTFGVGLKKGWHNDLGGGLLLGFAMLAVLLAGCLAFGDLDTRWTADEAAVSELIATVAVLAVSAANEELMFRGYPLQVLMRGIGAWPAMLFTSVVFGLMHAANPNAAALGTVNTVLAGMMLAVAYMKTRSLWLPFGIHVGWNVGLGVIMGFPLSGIDIASLWSSNGIGPESILGGSYGPEGGLLATFIFGSTALILYGRSWNSGIHPSTAVPRNEAAPPLE